MRKSIAAALAVGALLAGMLIGIQIGSNPKPVKVTKDTVTFKVGEKVTYGESDGTVVSIYRGNRYLVNYCGNIGWANHYDCDKTLVAGEELGKKK